jgi:arylsulfatase A-like enzyme
MKKPNILFLIVDQQNKDAVYGPRCTTPNINGLQKDGITFERAHSVNAICSPARASLMTGLLPHNHGMVDCTHNVEEFRANFIADESAYFHDIKNQGYKTAYFGKWHVERSLNLKNYGIDEYLVENHGIKFQRTLTDKLVVKQPGYNDRVVCGVHAEPVEDTEEHFFYSKAVDYVHTNQDKPWCLFVSTNAPHDPYIAPCDLYRKYDLESLELPRNFHDTMEDKPSIYRRLKSVWNDLKEEDWKKILGCYYAYNELIDIQVGRIVKALKDSDQYDNTLIVYMTDHGDLMGSHGLLCKGIPAFEEVYNIPLIMKLPNSRHKSERYPGLITTCDVFPTVMDSLGIKPENPRDGSSVLPFIEGAAGREDRLAYAEFYGQRMSFTQRIIWKGRYKYVFNGFDYDEFYDLQNDPLEMKNLINDVEYRETIKELTREMWKIVKDTRDESFLNTEYYMFRFFPLGPEQELNTSVYNRGA